MLGFADGHVNWSVGDQMTLDESQTLHAYIIELQWKAYNEDQQSRKRVTPEAALDC